MISLSIQDIPFVLLNLEIVDRKGKKLQKNEYHEDDKNF